MENKWDGKNGMKFFLNNVMGKESTENGTKK